MVDFSDKNSRLKRTEYLTATEHRDGPDIPIGAEGQCIIQIDEHEIMLMGGLTNNGTIRYLNI